tara:strand:+ start:232 stop:450 length:219 start_codon:yes stop_codon:yes gene_type:complete
VTQQKPIRKPPKDTGHVAQHHTFTRKDLFEQGEEKIANAMAQRLMFYLHHELDKEIDLDPRTIWGVTFQRLK